MTWESEQFDAIRHRLRGIENRLDAITRALETIMATLDQILDDVTNESSQIDSVGVLIVGLKQQLADALAGATLSPEVQAKVDAIFVKAEDNKAKIAAAIAADGPATPPVVPVPVTIVPAPGTATASATLTP
jgi:uncharacterized protein YoxC